uniref:Uncharacterized protein n=1 Tax=Anguilla anguilla TaxID=7936 RepID=A0A0E9RWG3_ANGAN
MCSLLSFRCSTCSVIWLHASVNFFRNAHQHFLIRNRQTVESPATQGFHCVLGRKDSCSPNVSSFSASDSGKSTPALRTSGSLVRLDSAFTAAFIGCLCTRLQL